MESTTPGPASCCVLLLVEASENLGRSRLGLALLQVDQVIDALLRRAARKPAGAKKFKVAVIGYAEEADRRVRFVPLLPGTERTTDLQSLADLLGGERQLRLDALVPAGELRAADGLHHAYLLLHHWLSAHPRARPPLVVHWGDGRRCDAAHARVSRSLRMLGCAAGAVGLAHVVLDENARQFVAEPESALPRTLRRIWLHSSPVALRHPGRALAVNTDPVRLVRALQRQARPVIVGAPASGTVSMRVLSLPKRGNTSAEIEDAWSTDEPAAIAAIADGASEGIFVRDWAELLTRSYLESRPDPRNLQAVTAWVDACRKVWHEKIDYRKLRWSQQNKVDETGGAATFLTWQLGRTARGEPAWQAWAVGDSCLFWVRDNRLRASFPLTHSRQFGNAPWLLSTRSDAAEPAPLFAAGRCRPGDLFVLATDAVSQYLLRAVERQKKINWDRLETVDAAVWRKRIEGLRDRNNIVNDDSTMVVIRVK